MSEAFEVSTKDPELELKVTILNINPEMNEELKEKCPVLKQYTQYVELVRYNSIGMPLEQAVETAIEYCIRHGILKDFLLKQRFPFAGSMVIPGSRRFRSYVKAVN